MMLGMVVVFQIPTVVFFLARMKLVTSRFLWRNFQYAILLIFMILFALYGNFKFPVTVMIGVVMTEPVGALIALKLTHTAFSVSSVLGLLALMGVSVETAVILVSYINKLRLESHDIRSATREAAGTAPG